MYSDGSIRLETDSFFIGWSTKDGTILFIPKRTNGLFDERGIQKFQHRIPCAGELIFHLMKELIDFIDAHIFKSLAISIPPAPCK